MSIMYITEFSAVDRTGGGGVAAIASIPALTTQAISFSTVAKSSAFMDNTKLIRIHVDGAANIAFGTDPTAIADTDLCMAAGQTEYFDIALVMGQGYKVSAIAPSSAPA